MTHTRIAEVLEALQRLAAEGGGELLLHDDHCAIAPCECGPLLLWQPPHGQEGWSAPTQFTGSHQRWNF